MYQYIIECPDLDPSEYAELCSRLDKSSYVAQRQIEDQYQAAVFCDDEPDEAKIRKAYQIPHQCHLRRM